MKNNHFLKKIKFLAFLLTLFSALFITSCVIKEDQITPKTARITSFDCSDFAYSDSVFFKSNQATDYIVSPTDTSLNGTFGVMPEGLEIDASTGEINVTESESGLKYKVFFVPTSTTDTCFKYITISGVDFLSQVYDLDDNDSIAAPIYRGLTANLPCSDDDDEEEEEDDEDDDDDCEFDDDEDDDDNDGTSDEPTSGQDVIPQGVDISKITGKINLKQSLVNGALGANPANGASKTFRIYYRLNDTSQKALNFIDVKIHYFENLSDVPQSLLNNINNKNNSIYNFVNFGNSNLRIQVAKPRPPDIIVVGSYAAE